MSMRRIALILLAVGIFAVAAGHFYPRWFGKKPASNMLKLSGNIEAHESLVSFKVQGRVIDLPVDEGMAVQTGDLLARLDAKDYRQQVDVDRAAVRVRQQQLAL